MKSPITGKEMSVHREWREMSFRKEKFRVLFHSYLCEDSGQKFEDESFANLNYNQLANRYRVKYLIPDPEKIRRIRKRYSVSGSMMAVIMGFGINSYRQYESGEIPSQSNGRLIQLAEDPQEFKKILELSNEIQESKKSKILKHLQDIEKRIATDPKESYLKKYVMGDLKASSKTGFKDPDVGKLIEMIVFFTEKLQPWKTKLNKLLFYSDFTCFKETAFSISGTSYKAIQMGPVPLKFNSLYEYLSENEEINIDYNVFPDGGVGERFSPANNRKFNRNIFSEREMKILETIAEKFSSISTQDIVDLSHKEKAWTENQESKSIIDYFHAFDLSI